MWSAATVLWSALWLALDPVYTITGKHGLADAVALRVELLAALAALSFYQFVFSAICAGGVAVFKQEKLPWLPKSRFELMLLFLNLAGQVLQMAAIAEGSVPQAQLVRSLEPLFLMMLTAIFPLSGPSYGAAAYMASLPIYVGLILFSAPSFVHRSLRDSLVGTLVFGCLSNLLLVARNVLSKGEMGKGTSPYVLLFGISFLPAVFLAQLLLLALTVPDLRSQVMFALANEWFILSGIAFFAMRMTSLLVLKDVSLLAHSLMKLVRRCFVVGMALFFAKSFSFGAWHLTGLTVTFCGVCCFELSQHFKSWSLLGAMLLACALAGGTMHTVALLLIH